MLPVPIPTAQPLLLEAFISEWYLDALAMRLKAMVGMDPDATDDALRQTPRRDTHNQDTRYTRAMGR